MKIDLKPAFFTSLSILLIRFGGDLFKSSGIGYKIGGIVVMLLGVLSMSMALYYLGFDGSDKS